MEMKMSLKEIVNQAAREAGGSRQVKAEPETAEVKAYYEHMDDFIIPVLCAPILDSLRGLKALNEGGGDGKVEGFGVRYGYHFSARYLRIEAYVDTVDSIEMNFNDTPPLFREPKSFVVIVNEKGEMAGREAITETKGYFIEKDVGVRGIMERLAAWAGSICPEKAEKIACVFEDAEKKYGLSGPARPSPSPLP